MTKLSNLVTFGKKGFVVTQQEEPLQKNYLKKKGGGECKNAGTKVKYLAYISYSGSFRNTSLPWKYTHTIACTLQLLARLSSFYIACPWKHYKRFIIFFV